MINRVILTGNLSRDPELRTTATGASILQYGIAVNEKVKEGNEWVDRASFFDVKMFGKRAEALESILTKGMKVTIEGRLRQDRWQDNEGRNKSKVVINADEIEFNQKRNEQPAQPSEDIPF